MLGRMAASARAAARAEVMMAPVLDRVAELQGFARRSHAQDDELSRLNAETTVLDVEISDKRVLVRSQQAAARAAEIERIARMAQDPANLERPDGGSNPAGQVPGSPALVRQPGARIESAAETIHGR